MTLYLFDWDPRKAVVNQRKHGVSFRQAATVFSDPNHLSLYDEGHDDTEERWITLGISGSGALLVVIHTFDSSVEDRLTIRLISARKATHAEATTYREMNP